MNQAVRPIPEGYRTVTPHLVCEQASEAIAFYKKAFGAVEIARLPGPDGKIMHAELRIGDSPIMLAQDFPEFGSLGPLALKGTPVVIHLYVEDADAVWAKALDAGAKPVMPLSDMFWGDRYGQVVDPFGHRWSIATHKQDLTPEQIMEGMNKMMATGCPGQQDG
ncbi:VOC family protein [Massilia sp. CFBP9012]|uniref:VOC family protein n=1 Tax=Massilia sp. CFBP9012 TaxID=3096531 RepID=UPI002A699EA8|nr:VOC family protein [Massilia sp. CFBP9012]MDY0977490.1 VOC family protein [Massilia sp. CFBP9012]